MNYSRSVLYAHIDKKKTKTLYLVYEKFVLIDVFGKKTRRVALTPKKRGLLLAFTGSFPGSFVRAGRETMRLEKSALTKRYCHKCKALRPIKMFNEKSKICNIHDLEGASNETNP